MSRYSHCIDRKANRLERARIPHNRDIVCFMVHCIGGEANGLECARIPHNRAIIYYNRAIVYYGTYTLSVYDHVV